MQPGKAMLKSRRWGGSARLDMNAKLVSSAGCASPDSTKQDVALFVVP